MINNDVLLKGSKLNEHQIKLVTVFFKNKSCSFEKWLSSNSFWFKKDGKSLSSTKLYAQKNGINVKNESIRVIYNYKLNSLYDLTMINNRTGLKLIDVRNISTDDMRDIISDVLPNYCYKIWSCIVSKFGSNKHDGYNTRGSFNYNSVGNECVKTEQ